MIKIICAALHALPYYNENDMSHLKDTGKRYKSIKFFMLLNIQEKYISEKKKMAV